MLYPEPRMEDLKKINSFLRQSGYAASTTKIYRWHLIHIARHMAHNALNFDTLDADQFVDFLDKQNWGDETRAQSTSALRAFVKFHYGRERDIMDIRVKKPKPKPQRTLTEEEIGQLLSIFDLSYVKGVRNYAMVLLALDTGLRPGEVASLNLESLNLKDRSLSVQIKGGAWAEARYSETTRDYLEDWIQWRQECARPDEKALFVATRGSNRGNRLTRSGLRANARRWAKRAGIKHFSMHAFRRSYATIALKNGAPTRIVQIGGRWSDIKMVERYSQSLDVKEIEPYLPTKNLRNEAGYFR